MAKIIIKEEDRKYEIITASSTKSLVKSVNDLIEKGYEPLGGVVIASGNQRAGNPNNEQLFIQTLYKKWEIQKQLLIQLFFVGN